ncbi:hypothetical protein BS78_07G040400 [Paspalum vaginatum]|nr:hypothetical protein BS78_07G040400 [Paspalum vaginatum]
MGIRNEWKARGGHGRTENGYVVQGNQNVTLECGCEGGKILARLPNAQLTGRIKKWPFSSFNAKRHKLRSPPRAAFSSFFPYPALSLRSCCPTIRPAAELDAALPVQPGEHRTARCATRQSSSSLPGAPPHHLTARCPLPFTALAGVPHPPRIVHRPPKLALPSPAGTPRPPRPGRRPWALQSRTLFLSFDVLSSDPLLLWLVAFFLASFLISGQNLQPVKSWLLRKFKGEFSHSGFGETEKKLVHFFFHFFKSSLIFFRKMRLPN